MPSSTVVPFASEPGTDSDEMLMLAAAQNDLAAFETLVTRHQNRIYRMAYQMLGNEEDAWDVSQEIFVKIYNARATYVEDAKFTTWLYRIANNAVIDRIRQNRRHAAVVSMENVVIEPASVLPTAEQFVAWGEKKGDLQDALAQLTERQRGMVLLKYYEGFSVKEIAEVFDCATGTVKATLFQALRNMRQHLNLQGISGDEVRL